MAISGDYWTNFINIEDDVIHPRDCGTPITPGDSRTGLLPFIAQSTKIQKVTLFVSLYFNVIHFYL